MTISLNEKSSQIKQLQNRFCLPHKALQSYVAHYTFSLHQNEIHTPCLTLVPDASGCLVFTMTESGLICRFWGPTTKTTVVKNNNVPLRFFVEFQPGGSYFLFGIDLSSLTDCILPLADIDPQTEKKAQLIFEQSESTGDMIDHFDRLLLEKLERRQKNDVITKLYPCLKSCCASTTVGDLSSVTAYSPRHLNRLLSPVLGMNVKGYLRLLRINRLLQSVNSGQTDFTKLALDMGYFDQAHFIHDFKSVVDVTPTQYLKQMSVFYNENHKF